MTWQEVVNNGLTELFYVALAVIATGFVLQVLRR